MPRSYYNDVKNNNFINSVYALDLSIIEFVSNLLLDGDQTRMIYSSNQFAPRKRASTQKNNNLNFPFINFRLKPGGYNHTVERNWRSHPTTIRGLYLPGVSEKVKVAPITLQYEATLFLHYDIDGQYARHAAIFDEARETLVNYELEVDGEEVKMIGVFDYNIDWNPEFTEQDWLQKNKITTMRLDFEVQTFNIKTGAAVTIPEKALLNFITNYDLEVGSAYDENYNIVVPYLQEEVDLT